VIHRRSIKAIALIALILAAYLAGRHSTSPPRAAGRSTPTSGSNYPAEFDALCTRVIDGDTIVIEGDEHVRYIGMDTPEMRPIEAFGEAATEANRELVEGKSVRLVLDVERRDRYGRLLAYVYAGDTFVNAELVRRGLAQIATYPPNVRHERQFLRLQREAREAGRGLWSMDSAQTGTAAADSPESH